MKRPEGDLILVETRYPIIWTGSNTKKKKITVLKVIKRFFRILY